MGPKPLKHRSVLIIAAVLFAVINIVHLHTKEFLPIHQQDDGGFQKLLLNFKKNPPQEYVNPVDIRYVGVAGLGHRLIRMSSAYHLARALEVSSLDVFWRGFCPSQSRSKPNIFQFLFDNDAIDVSTEISADMVLFPFANHSSASSLKGFVFGASMNTNSTKKYQLKIVNELEGYTHMYEAKDVEGLDPPFYGKLETDFEFYSRLIERFKYRTNVDELLAFHAKKHTVVGVHIRAGNGEVGDFEKFRQLGQGNLFGWLHNFTDLLKKYVLVDETILIRGKPPLIFLATDTPSVVEYFRTNLGRSTQVLVTPQHYPTQGKGVSYNGDHANLTMCLESWKYQMMDMAALSEYADILISGQYSSFIQSLPVSRILNDKERRRFFCDVDRLALGLKCFDSTKGGISGWLSSDDTHARYLGAMDKVDNSSFAGPQIFFPIHLTAEHIREMVHGKRKKKRMAQT
eukprot:scaffold22713_cov139-Cylindrotheca_fusiformis.AAC.9